MSVRRNRRSRIIIKAYRNLTKKCYSLMQDNKVVAHGDNFVMVDCRFLVSERGRSATVASGKKQVHAFVCGYLTNLNDVRAYRGRGVVGIRDLLSYKVQQDKLCNGFEDLTKVTYNPFKNTCFMTESGPVQSSKFVYFNDQGVFI